MVLLFIYLECNSFRMDFLLNGWIQVCESATFCLEFIHHGSRVLRVYPSWFGETLLLSYMQISLWRKQTLDNDGTLIDFNLCPALQDSAAMLVSL